MAFPNTITTDNSIPNGNGQTGPFLIGGALYVLSDDFDVNPGLLSATMYKSTDNGLTWTILDGANGPSTGGASGEFGVCSDGTKIFLSHGGPTDATLFVAIFDTGSETWTSNTDSGIALSFSVTGNPTTGISFRAFDSKCVVGFSPASLIVTTITPTFVDRVGYVIFDPVGLTFSSVTAIGQIGDPTVLASWIIATVQPGNGFTHFFMVAKSTSNQYQQQALSDGGSNGTLASIASADSTLTGKENYPAYSDGTTIILAGVAVFGTNQIDVYVGTSADPISFSTVSIIVTGATEIDSLSPVLSFGNSYVMVNSFDGTSQTVKVYTDTGGGFGLPDTLGLIGSPFLWADPLAISTTVPWGIVLRGAAGQLQYWQPVGTPPTGLGSYCFTNN